MSYTYTRCNSEDTISAHPVLTSVARHTGIVLLAILVAWGTCQLGRLGLDWGYYVTKIAVGQLESDRQYSGAMALFFFVFPSLAAGIASGALTGILGGRFKWHTAIIPALLGFTLLRLGVEPLNADQVFGLGGMLLLYTITTIPAAVFFKALAKRNRASRLLMACVPAMIIAAFLPLADLEHSWTVELPIYCELIILTGLLSAVALRAKTYSIASGAATVGVLPITVFNFANVVFTIVCMAIPSSGIDWHALVSALIISAVTITCAELGAFLGLVCVKLRSRNAS